MDAMPQGGALTLRTRRSGDRTLIEIADTGAGLTPEECERLFTPYYTSKAHGTGLGAGDCAIDGQRSWWKNQRYTASPGAAQHL